MLTLRYLAAAVVLSAAIVAMAAPASAAASYDACTGFIDAVPAVITTQGTWCLRHDIGTAASNIRAIEIQAHNVTIDCNGFKLGNVAAGTDTQSIGIYADGISNITVHHCTILGFHDGINIDDATAQSGHLIEDNRLLLNRVLGINVMGPGTIIRRNTVTNTGGNSTSTSAAGIRTSGDVIDNVVDGIDAGSGAANFTPVGIGDITANGILIQGNRVRNLTQKGSGIALGIDLGGGAIGGTVRDNYVVQDALTTGTAITCFVEGRVRDNVARHYSTGLSTNCSDDGGNVVY